MISALAFPLKTQSYMSNFSLLIYVTLAAAASPAWSSNRAALSALTNNCEDAFKPQIERAHAEHLIRQMSKPHAPGQHGVRLISWNGTETPDPDHPIPIQFPDGQKWVMGLSGQSILVADRLSDFNGSQRLDPVKIRLVNRNGFPYGEEIEDGVPVDYTVGSTAWDAFVVGITGPKGIQELKIFAGTMGDDAYGRPLLQRDSLARPTRQRTVFDAKFIPQPDGTHVLTGYNPRTFFGYQTPTGKNWLLKDGSGITRFAHGYGGGPMVLENGELYLNPNGYLEMYHEEVVEERDGWPYRTAIIRTFLDPIRMQAVGERKIVLDVFKPSRGSNEKKVAYAATKRLDGGFLIEGSHVQALIRGVPARSMDEIRSAREKGIQITLRMVASPGDYFSTYGSAMAIADAESSSFRYVEDGHGELYDFLKDLRPLFTWMGRPVLYVDEFNQEMVAFHGVPRTSLPDEIPLDIFPHDPKTFARFKRGILTSPIEPIRINGAQGIRLKDNTGLLKRLRNFAPRSALLDYVH